MPFLPEQNPSQLTRSQQSRRLVGYCTNVHPGSTLAETTSQLETHAKDVLEKSGLSELGIGLWLNNQVASELTKNPAQLNAFQAFLLQNRLIPYTFNGFPFGNFHQPVVKKEVYRPDWTCPERLHYTTDLASILSIILPAGNESIGTISTLPIGWGKKTDKDYHQEASKNFLELVDFLSDLEERTGKRIQVCIEPEPGCTLGNMTETIAFFLRYLTPKDNLHRSRIRRYLSVCYDTCHAAVMKETVPENLRLLKEAELEIGKVQVSNAPFVEFDQLSTSERESAWQQLESFSEPKYLHQTTVLLESDGQQFRFYEDLTKAMEDSDVFQKGQWTVHFHVPIDCSRIQNLGTTSNHNLELAKCASMDEVKVHHWEVETYAWNVLPKENQPDNLATGISREVVYLENLLNNNY